MRVAVEMGKVVSGMRELCVEEEGSAMEENER